MPLISYGLIPTSKEQTVSRGEANACRLNLVSPRSVAELWFQSLSDPQISLSGPVNGESSG